MRKTSKKVAIVAAGTALALTGGGVAYAYWTTTGTGTGSASTSAGASNLTITQDSAPTGMAPGVLAGGISGHVTNNAANNAYVADVTVSIASVTGGAGTCDATDYTLSSPVMHINQDLAPGASANFSGATLGFNNKATNQDGCKGATVNLAYVSN